MPPDWQPPVDAWQSTFAADVAEVVIGYFGCQHRTEQEPAAFDDRFRAAVRDRVGRPAVFTRARYRDASGYTNEVFIAYWRSAEDFADWWELAGFGLWFRDAARRREAFGLWREVFVVPMDRLETLFSSRHPSGVAKLAKPFAEPVREHNYWGAMRDRLAVSRVDALDSGADRWRANGNVSDSRGRRISVRVPVNICFIRSGQNWRDCDEHEFAEYSDHVVPHLTAGMAFLRDQGREVGCLICRFMDELSMEGNQARQSFGFAAFVSMAHLEAWAQHHPTHLRIFENFLQVAQCRSNPPNLKLWHEVFVTGKDGATAEYVNCHPNTGFLPHFAEIS